MGADSAARRRRPFLDLALRRAQPGSGSGLDFLLRRTWSDPRLDLRAVRTPYVVVGGVATALYMPQRFTLDLDVLVPTDAAARIHQELDALGLERAGRLAFGGTRWRSSVGEQLDVLESGEPWAEEAVSQPNRSPSGLPVITLPYLVLTKLAASQPQDLADICRMLGAADDIALEAVRAATDLHRPRDRDDLERLIALGRLEYRAETGHDGS
jgi:hypothetical protein